MAEVDDSCYFATASDSLRAPDQTKHKVVPRRSSYFNNSSIQVADSERAVPGTPREPSDHTSASQLHVSRRNSESIYTSQSVPVVAKPLKILTCDVSREHGTMSQSVRRRPSLPFQSPTKVR